MDPLAAPPPAPRASAADAPAEPGAERPIRQPLDPRNPLAGLFIATMLFELAEGALRFLVPINLDASGLGPQAIGFVMFAFSLTSLLSRGAAAALFRPERARRLVVGAGLASSAAYLALPFVDQGVAFAVLMAIDGFGWGLATTCLLAMIMVCTPASMPPAVAMGWYIGFQGLAFAVATTVGGVLGQLAGVRPAMLVLASGPVLAAALIAWRMPPVVRPMPAAPPAPAASDAGRARRRLAGLALLPAAVWTAAVVAVYLNVMNGLLQSFFPLLGLAAGLSIAQIGTLSSFRSAVSTVARFGAGWLFARVPARRLHLPLLAMSAGTLALLPSAGSYLVHLPLFGGNGISRGLLRVTTNAAAMEEIAPGQAGGAAAVMTAGLDVGKMIGPLVGGVAAAAIGLEGMFRVVPLAFLALYVLVALAAPRRRGRRGAGEPVAGPSGSTPPSLNPHDAP